MKIKKFFFILISTLLISFSGNSEVPEIIDSYNKSSFASSYRFKQVMDKELTNKLHRNVFKINEIINFKKYHAIVPMVIDDEACPNAFATTANNIYVCKELVSNLSDCELRYIVAHEIAHIVNEDFINTANKNIKTDNIESEIAFKLNKNKYSRIQEVIADRDAVVWTMLTGCDEKSLISAEEKLSHGDEILEDSTHPNSDYRVRTIKDKARRFKYVKNNNISDFKSFMEIKEYNQARTIIEEYIAFNLNSPFGYIKRMELNYLLFSKNGSMQYKNAILQDCKLIKNNFNKINKICDKIK